MPLNGNELQINSKKYLMQLIDGNLFYLGKLLEKKRKSSFTRQNDEAQTYIFVFEHNPPLNKAFYITLWHHYRIFIEANSLDDHLDEINEFVV
jgi:hypothetical protein